MAAHGDNRSAGERNHGRCCLRALLLALVFPLFSSTGFAQGNGPSQFVRFTVFAARPLADVAFVPRAGVEARKLTFYPTARSPRYEYQGVMPLRFVDATSGEPVAEAMIPPNITDALLLFLTPAKGEGGDRLRYRVAVLDDSAARHGAGSLAIINLSGLALSGTVNANAIALQPGLNPTIGVGRSARVMLRTDLKGRSYQSYADTISIGSGRRALLLLFPPFYQGSLEAQARVLVDAPGVPHR